MVTCKADLAQVIAHRGGVLHVFGSDRGQPDDRIHWRSDIVRHRGEEVCLCLVGTISRYCCSTKLSVKLLHAEKIEYEKEQKPQRDNPRKCPADLPIPERFHTNHRNQNPVVCRVDSRMCNQALCAGGVPHCQHTRVAIYTFSHTVELTTCRAVVRPIKFEKIGIFERVST